MGGSRTVLAAVVTALLITTAGCGVFGGGGGSNGGSTTTTTVGTPADLEVVAPGVAKRGIVNTSKLMAAHERSLSKTGFVYTFRHKGIRIVEDDPGRETVVEYRLTGKVRVASNYSAYRQRVIKHAAEPPETTIRWGNGTAGYAREQAGEEIRYSTSDARPGRGIAKRPIMGTVIKKGVWTLKTTKRGGERIVMTATGPSEFFKTDDKGETAMYSGRLVVTDEGRILSLRVNATISRGDNPGALETFRETQIFRYELQRTGDVSIGTPEWLSAAHNATEEEDLSIRGRARGTSVGRVGGAWTVHGGGFGNPLVGWTGASPSTLSGGIADPALAVGRGR